MKIRDRIKELRRVKASELLANPRNWRKHPTAQQNALRGVLAEVGWADAVIARETPEGLMLIDGHLRGDVAGDAEIPVLVLDVDEAEADKILATLDPLAAMAEVDPDSLRDLLGQVETQSSDLEQLLDGLATNHGIDFDALAEAATADEPEPLLDRAAELRKKWKTKLGQMWLIEGKAGEHRLCCQNAAAALPSWVTADFDAVITDPPYGILAKFGEIKTRRGYGDKRAAGTRTLEWPWDDPAIVPEVAGILDSAFALCQNAAGCFVWCGFDSADEYAKPARRAGFTVKPAAWVKPHPAPAGKGNWWPSAFELGYYGYRGSSYFGDRDPKRSNVFSHDSYRHGQPGKVAHPTQKPFALIERIVSAIVPEKGQCLDPFLGSGTTMVAAEQLGRVCHGIEIEPKYVAVALERMKGLGLEPRLAPPGEGKPKPRKRKPAKKTKTKAVKRKPRKKAKKPAPPPSST